MSLALLNFKSITNSMRHVCLINKRLLWNKKSINQLLLYRINRAGRNNTGKITVFSKGRRKHCTKSRLICFKSFNHNIPGTVCRLEYDPGRSAFIGLVIFKNNLFCYILASKNMYVGDTISFYKKKPTTIKRGDRAKLLFFGVGSPVYNIEHFPNCGGVYIRSAGTYGSLVKKYLHKGKGLVALPSGKAIFLSLHSYCNYGCVSNANYKKLVLGKAGRSRWLGRKPIVRGVAMNPIDHPHGGGEGKKNVKLKKTPWGKINSWTNNRVIWRTHI